MPVASSSPVGLAAIHHSFECPPWLAHPRKPPPCPGRLPEHRIFRFDEIEIAALSHPFGLLSCSSMVSGRAFKGVIGTKMGSGDGRFLR